MTLQRFNGDEVFSVAEATVDFYIEVDQTFATTFRAVAATPPMKTLPDTEELHAKPFAELMLYLSKHPGIALLTGRSCTLAEGYDQASGEHLTNFYYGEHELVDDVEIAVLKRDGERAHLRLTGTTVDVNHYDGSKPKTKILIDAEFTLKFVRRNA